MADGYISEIKLPDNSIYELKDNAAVHGNTKVYYGTCNTAAATKEKQVILTNENFILEAGTILIVKFTNASAKATMTLSISIDGGSTYSTGYNIYQYGTTTMADGTTTSGWSAGAIVMFIYDGSSWYRNYWYNTTYTISYQNLLSASGANRTAETAENGGIGIHRYSLQMMTTNLTWSSIASDYKTTATSNGAATNKDAAECKFLLTSPIIYQDTNANAAPGGTANVNGYTSVSFDLRYSTTNAKWTALVIQKPVFLVGDLQDNGLTFKLDSTLWWTQTLPNSATNGKIYIYLGLANSATAVYLSVTHPVYWHDGTQLQLYNSYAATVPLSGITDADDLKAIEALGDSSTGLLKKTNANTWTLDTNTYSTTNHNHDTTYLKLNGSNNMTADVNIIAGDTDKFINFWYNTNKIAGASWRVGMLGSGSNNTNYFVIQSGTATTSATTWHNALKIGQNNYDIYNNENRIPNTGNTTGSVGSTTTPVYVDAGQIKAGTALEDLAYIAKPSSNTTTTYLRGDGSWVSLSDMGLSTAMHFLGVATVAITDSGTEDPKIGGNATTVKAGDVVIDSSSSREYVWSTAGKWELLGGDSSYKTLQDAVNDPTAATTTSTTFIDTISQNTNGVITATKKTLPTASSSVAGITKVGVSGGAAAYSHGTHVTTATVQEALSITSSGSATKALTEKGTFVTFGTSNLTIGTTSSTAMAGNTVVTNVAISANTTTNANYPIVFATSNKDTTAAKNEGLQKSGAKFYFNPSTGNVQATTFNGYTLAAASAKAVVTSIDTSANLPTSNAVKTFVEEKGYVTSSGVTSITLKAGAGITLDTDNTAITSTGTRTISISGINTTSGSETTCLTAKGTWKTFGTSNLTIGTTSSTAMAGNTTVTNVAISADTTTNKDYAVVFGTTPSDGTSPTAAKTEGLQKNIGKFYFNPSSGSLNAISFCVDEHVNLKWNSTDSALEFVFA